jgi:hypothetical protein
MTGLMRWDGSEEMSKGEVSRPLYTHFITGIFLYLITVSEYKFPGFPVSTLLRS